MAVRLIQMILFTACVTVFWASGLAAWKASSLAACSRTAAWERAKDRVRAELVAPRDAAFPTLGEVTLVRAGPCTWDVQGHVDASNLHGVFLRADFRLTVGRDVHLEALTTRAPSIELASGG